MGKYRKSVFIVVYSEEKNIEYLILKRHLHWTGWEFPKGGIKGFERKMSAVERELNEETGLRALEIHKFNYKEKYDYEKELMDRKGVKGQIFYLYGVRVRKGQGFVALDEKEHENYKWVKFGEAKRRLKWENQKECLNIVNEWLKSNKPNKFLI